jgi:hypothetical protein
MSQAFRALTAQERSALETMLSVEFRNHQQLQMQVNDLALRPIDETLFELTPLSLPVEFSEKRTKKFGVPFECTYTDKDGAVVYVDLFVNEDDALVELEIWKPDGSAVQTYFADADLAVKVQAT